MINGAMVNSQTPQRLTSDPPELRIRFLIQISGWIWGFFLKLGPSEILGLHNDVILFVRVCACGKQREMCSRPSLGIQGTLQLVPAAEGAVSQSGSVNLSAYPSKYSPGPPGSQIRALARA